MKPPRSPKYLAWVRTLPCSICGRWPVESAHMGAHGIGQKSSDFSCIPLCPDHHRTAQDAAHQLGRRFAQHHSLDLPALTERLNKAWLLVSGETELSATARRTRSSFSPIRGTGGFIQRRSKMRSKAFSGKSGGSSR